jgi:hypothetical protein
VNRQPPLRGWGPPRWHTAAGGSAWNVGDACGRMAREIATIGERSNGPRPPASQHGPAAWAGRATLTTVADPVRFPGARANHAGPPPSSSVAPARRVARTGGPIGWRDPRPWSGCVPYLAARRPVVSARADWCPARLRSRPPSQALWCRGSAVGTQRLVRRAFPGFWPPLPVGGPGRRDGAARLLQPPGRPSAIASRCSHAACIAALPGRVCAVV